MSVRDLVGSEGAGEAAGGEREQGVQHRHLAPVPGLHLNYQGPERVEPKRAAHGNPESRVGDQDAGGVGAPAGQCAPGGPVERRGGIRSRMRVPVPAAPGSSGTCRQAPRQAAGASQPWVLAAGMPGEHPTRRGQAQVQVRAGEQVALSAGSRGADSELQLWQVKAAGRTGSAPICPACVLSLSRADSGAAWRRPNTGDPSESAGVRPRAPACGSCCLTDLRAAGVVGLRAAVQPGGRPQTSCSGYCPREPPGAPRRLSFRTGSRIATVPRSVLRVEDPALLRSIQPGNGVSDGGGGTVPLPYR